LLKLPIEGGTPTQLTEDYGLHPVVSPDGQWIACFYALQVPDSVAVRGQGARTIAMLSINGGPAVKTFETLPAARGELKWTPDGKAVAYIASRGGVSNIWAQPIDGGPPKQLTNFNSEQVFNFAWSRDGKQLALSRGVVNRDVVLITGLK
jgi:Tol biopolymer transport system component